MASTLNSVPNIDTKDAREGWHLINSLNSERDEVAPETLFLANVQCFPLNSYAFISSNEPLPEFPVFHD